MPGVPEMGEFVFRANPSFELLVFDRLSAAEKSALAPLTSDTDFYGVLRPGTSGLNLKSVNRDLALLFSTLQTPGKIPAYVRAELGAAYEEFVTQLVLDQVLQVEHNGAFVCGAGAQHLFVAAEATHQPTSRVSELSQQAVKHAQYLDIDDALMLGARIYFYNREPASPQLMSEYSTEAHVARRLGVLKGTESDDRLSRKWSEVPADPANAGWRIWKRKHKGKGKSGFGYKLYVSPRTEALSDAFSAAAETFGETGVQQFKVGRDIYGMLRPDKLVAYFATEEQLRDTSERLYARVGGMAAHGVPFTCELHGDGLLSWGMDPPKRAQVLAWQERQSWRLWVVNKLATALLAAKAQPSHSVEPWKFALQRVRLDGIETNSWTPSPDIFRRVNET
jgi:hypothetical protein